jgi:predicted transposase/invertase (TIGR01784 family)
MAERRKDYDSAYKYLFSNKRIFHQFLTQFIDESFTRKIRLEDIEQVDRSFVSDEFLKRESDIIYKVKLEGREVYIYVLLEFQSTVDKSIPVWMLLYILQLYDQLIRNSRRGKLPAVFPILLYNGSEKWTVGRDIARLIEQSIPAKYIP